MNEVELFGPEYDRDDYDEDRDIPCDGCGRMEDDEGWCPMCCPNGGMYQPGTEDCDFCPCEEECAYQ